MTSDNDSLAPVTPLFGASAADDALRSAVSRHPAGTGRGGRRAAMGASDATGLGVGETDVEPTESDTAKLGRPSAEGWSSGRPGADEAARPGPDEAGSRSTLRALPTYAAFAATTESAAGPAAGGPRTAGPSAAEPSAAEPSAFVRDALDTRSPAERRTDARIAARKQAEEALRSPRRAAVTPVIGGIEQGDPSVSESRVSESGESESGESDPETFEAAKQRAENISLHALSRRGVSSVEMARILTSRDLPDEVVALEIERLERVGLLDDTELAENLVRSKQERKGLGKGAISAELRQRGVAQEAIEAAISEIDDDDEQARCDEWAEKRVGQLRGLDHATAERRLNGYLMRRGYRSEVIRRSIEKALPKGGSGGGVRFR